MADNNVTINQDSKSEFTVSVYSPTGTLIKEYRGFERCVKILEEDIDFDKFVFIDSMGKIHTIKNAIIILDEL